MTKGLGLYIGIKILNDYQIVSMIWDLKMKQKTDWANLFIAR